MFKLFKNLDKKDWCLVVLTLLLVSASVFFELSIPDYMSEITKIIGLKGSFNEIIVAGLKMVSCAILGAGCSCIVGFLSSIISANFAYKLRGLIFLKVQSFSIAEIKGFSTSSLIIRSTNDVNQVQNVLTMGLKMAVKSPIMAVWAICKILSKSWQWSLATACAVVFIVIILTVVIVFALPKFKVIQKQTDNLTRVSRENLTGVRVVRAFNAEGYQEEKFDNANKELTDTCLSINGVMSLIDPALMVIFNILPLSIYFIGAYLISVQTGFESKLFVFSDMVVFSSYAIQVVMSIVMLVIIFINLPRAIVSANRINEVLNMPSTVTDGAGNTDTDIVGEVEFNNVSFKYPDAEEYVLKDISFKAKKGQTVAFIGSTGSGKSTLINLVPRFYDATSGEIKIDGVDVKDYKLYDLNSKIAVIAQRPILFSGTVLDNVTLGETDGEKPTEEDVIKAIKISKSDFVLNYPDKLNHEVNQGGKNYSGGQKQRLAIARALARNPEILIFDDSFSALDYKTDKELRIAIKQELTNTTCLIVAQRIGTIKDADKIIVLDNGVVVGEGTHKELLENCSVYKEIALSQLSEEELKNG